MDQKRKEYVESWKADSDLMYQNRIYDWMVDQVKEYKTVLEIGCGVGISTLCLLEEGHDVICVEFNEKCVEETRNRLNENGYPFVEIINLRVSENNIDTLLDIISKKIDVVICWNPGGVIYFSKDEMSDACHDLRIMNYPPINSQKDLISFFAEDMERAACKLSSILGVDANIVDRFKPDEDGNSNFSGWINEYSFSSFCVDSRECEGDFPTLKYKGKVVFKSYLFKR